MAQQIYTVEIDGQQYDLEGDRPPTEAEARAAIQSRGQVSPVAAAEPGDYWAGARRGAVEGMTDGAKGFVTGLLESPKSALLGLLHVATTRPDTTIKELITSISDLPDAIRSAGVDPEQWGRQVGNLTGQTMISVATPAAVRGTVRVGERVAASPLAARVLPKLVKHGATAAGAYFGGAPGAIVGSAVGDELVNAMKPSAPAPAPTAPAAAPPVTAPASAAPVVPFNPGAALSQIRQTFAQLQVTPQAAEVSNAAALVKRGLAPEEAVRRVVANRPPDPAAALAQRLGTPSDAAMQQALQSRNATGRW